jgi:ribosomal protein S18 acetylase RimI-like enzyme
MKIRPINSTETEFEVNVGNKTLEHHQLFDEFYSPVTDCEEVIQTEKITLVSEDDNGEIIGLVSGVVVLNPKDRSVPFAVLRNIWVDVEKRNHGIATQLHTAFAEKVRSFGVGLIDLNVDLRNKEGNSFWNNLGYETYQERKRKSID